MWLTFLAALSSTAPRRVMRRPLALLASVACLSGYLFGFAHMLVVEHVRCLEHGELSHGGPAQAGDEPAEAGARLLGGGPEHADDDHCPAAGLGPVRPQAARACTLVPWSAPDQLSAFDSQLPHPGVAVLRWAPKTSPPAFVA